MTTAFNFPDLDISPVYFESGGDVDEREQQAVSGRNPSLNDYALHEVLGGLSISDYDNGRSLYDFTQGQIFAGFENEVLSKEDQPFPQRSSQLNGKSTDADRCYPTETGYSFNTSSEEVFAAMECEMRQWLSSIAESCDIAGNLCDSFSNILSGCRVTVEMGCCKESAEDVRSRLRRMGAVVSRRLTGTTTHVVYSFGGKPTVLKRIFAQTKRPFLVDPHWVYECFKSRGRVSEEQFSLYECRYLLNVLRQNIDEQNASQCRDIPHFENSDVRTSTSISFANERQLPCRRLSEVTFDKTMSASELLVKIDLLSKRLDRIAGIPNCVLGNRCPSALKGDGRSIAANHYGLNKDARKGSMSVGVMRRRTHSAFPLEYREPLCDAVLWARRLKDEQDAICGRTRRYNFTDVHSDKENEGSGPIHSNNLATLPRKVLQGVEANVEDVRQPVEIRVSQRPHKSVEDSSELDGLLGFRAPPHGGVYGPLVKTSSSLINNLQLESSSEDFINKRRPCAVSRSRDGIVFTGFPKRKEKELHADVIGLGLKVQKKINKQTHCVISANGERTLNVMRAVILGIPVITATWIEMCLEQNRFLPVDKFYYEQWQELIQKRAQHQRLFSNLGEIFICERCSPSPRDMKWLVENSGGHEFFFEESLELVMNIWSCSRSGISTDPSHSSLVVAPRQHSLEILCSEDMEVHPPVVIEKYILDCITENTVLKFDDYMEHEVVDELD